MLRRQPPSVLVYSFGIALLLSLSFNGFLLLQSGRSTQLHASAPAAGTDTYILREELLACNRAVQNKDSLIHALESSAHPASIVNPPSAPTR